MRVDQDWEYPEVTQASRLNSAGMGVIRIALLFGSAAVAVGLIVAPIAERQLQRSAGLGGVDTMTTGSIGNRDIYTMRRSVLQSSPHAVCIIHTDGRRSGDCR
ncbi:hypothetical protein ABGN05_12335 [Aquibium sp. LZ166]|uniref:Uncharacterized protein n=1 Tax=Aquibium pacificus TaxID=3153579 RepID=A0ABV3SKP1_9HYPH